MLIILQKVVSVLFHFLSQRLNWELVRQQWGGGWVPLCNDKEKDLQSSSVAGACLTLKEPNDIVTNSFVLKLAFIHNHMDFTDTQAVKNS